MSTPSTPPTGPVQPTGPAQPDGASHPAGPAQPSLALPDELLLLATDDETGRIHGSSLDIGLAGAVLVELALHGRVAVEEKEVAVLDPTPTGDPVLDDVLARIGASERRRSAKHWVSGSQKGLRSAVTARLVAAGTLREDRRTVLGLFPVTRHPGGDPGPESRVRARLDDAVLRGPAPDERTAAPASLVGVLGLCGAVFPGADRRSTDARLKELAEGAWAPEAVRRAIQDLQTAMMTAVIAASAATTSTSS